MRVYVERDMTVNHNTNVVTLKAGDVIEGPLATFLVESDCAVTIEHDDRPGAAPAAEQESHTPGAGATPEGGEGQQEEPEGAETAEPSDPAEQEPAEPGAEA